jgi:hypothetical protein
MRSLKLRPMSYVCGWNEKIKFFQDDKAEKEERKEREYATYLDLKC